MTSTSKPKVRVFSISQTETPPRHDSRYMCDSKMVKMVGPCMDLLEWPAESSFNVVLKKDYESALSACEKRLEEANKKLESLNKDFFLAVIDEWQQHWMSQNFNEQDTQNYRRRALGVDANMRYGLARMIVETLNKGKAP